MANTVIFKTEDGRAYGWYRFFHETKMYRSGVTCDINSLIIDMKSNSHFFHEPFNPETKLPEIDLGNLKRFLFGLVSINELKEVRQALGLSETSS